MIGSQLSPMRMPGDDEIHPQLLCFTQCSRLMVYDDNRIIVVKPFKQFIERLAPAEQGAFRSPVLSAYKPYGISDEHSLIEQHFDTCIAQRFNYLFNLPTVVFMIAEHGIPSISGTHVAHDPIQLLLLEWLRFFIDNVAGQDDEVRV